jgi:hypothetical protein
MLIAVYRASSIRRQQVGVGLDATDHNIRGSAGGRSRDDLLQPELAGRACSVELGASHVAAHGGQAPVPGMAHDLLIRNPVFVGRRDEASAHPVRRDRLPDGPGKSRNRRPFLEDLPDSVGIEPACMNSAPAIDLPKDRP